jgi:NAD(P)H-flavin reductase
MAKYTTIGKVLKSKDFSESKETYIKIEKDVALKAGQYVNVVDPRKLAERLMNKVSDEVLAKIKERGEKTPHFVLFELQVKNDG